MDDAFASTGAMVMGRRLFDDVGELDLERTSVIESPGVTHLRFRVAK